MLWHAQEAGHIPELYSHMPSWLQVGLYYGKLGVPVFFVLSGFVIAHSLFDRRMSLSLFGRFTLRRLIRLDPPYWFAITLGIGFSVLASAVVIGRPPVEYSLGQIVAHLFYLQGILGYQNINSVFWTLCYEIQFYLAYAILLAVGRNDNEARFQGGRTATLFLIAGSVSLLWPLGLGPDLPRGLFPPYWHSFLLGVAAYWAWRDRGVLPVFAGYALIIGVSAIARGSSFSLVCAVTATTLLLVGIFNRLETTWNWRWLQFLGAISYSLYLTHNPITGATFRVGYLITGHNVYTEALWWAVSSVFCIAFAGAVWWAIERPSIRFARKIGYLKR
jgi:peptidoglycan/LPS O-acetylase OafA/YrhL